MITWLYWIVGGMVILISGCSLWRNLTERRNANVLGPASGATIDLPLMGTLSTKFPEVALIAFGLSLFSAPFLIDSKESRKIPITITAHIEGISAEYRPNLFVSLIPNSYTRSITSALDSETFNIDADYGSDYTALIYASGFDSDGRAVVRTEFGPVIITNSDGIVAGNFNKGFSMR